MRAITPDAIRPPFAHYSHAYEATAGARLLFSSGQLGLRPDDTLPEGAEAQAAQCFANLDAILAEAGMGRGNVIKITAYVTGREHMAGYMKARDAWVEGFASPPASTLLIVGGFTRPEFLVEIEMIAAAGG